MVVTQDYKATILPTMRDHVLEMRITFKPLGCRHPRRTSPQSFFVIKGVPTSTQLKQNGFLFFWWMKGKLDSGNTGHEILCHLFVWMTVHLLNPKSTVKTMYDFWLLGRTWRNLGHLIKKNMDTVTPFKLPP